MYTMWDSKGRENDPSCHESWGSNPTNLTKQNNVPPGCGDRAAEVMCLLYVSTSRLLLSVGGLSLRTQSWLRLYSGSFLDFEKFIVQTLVKYETTQEPGAATQVWHQ